MTQDGWRELVIDAFTNGALLEMLAQLLAEQDAAKARLQRLGFGVTGSPWPDVVDEIAEASIPSLALPPTVSH